MAQAANRQAPLSAAPLGAYSQLAHSTKNDIASSSFVAALCGVQHLQAQ